MKIILTQDVPKLGGKGEIKEVNPGFARNFLFPKDLAVLPNDPKAKEISKEKLTHQAESKKEKTETEAKAAKIDGQTFIFKAKADKKGNLYGSIGPKELAAKIGIEEDLIKEHFKTLGTFPLEIKISPAEIIKLTVVIEKEK